MSTNSHAEYPGAIWMPHQHYWPGRNGHAVRYVVIHGTASPGLETAEAIARYFQTTTRETGTHYVIGKDGRIVQCVREGDSAWGNGIVTAGHDPWWGGRRGNPNLETVSIEHVKTGAHNEDPLTPAQMDASFRLIAYLVRKYQIPPRWADASGGVTGHFSIDPVNKRFCPGPYPWEELFHELLAPAEYPGLPTASSSSNRPYPVSGLPTLGDAATSGDTRADTAEAGAGGGGGTLRGAGTRAHEALQQMPGFGGIVAALDRGARFQPLAIESPTDIFGWLGANTFALIVRVLLVALGLAPRSSSTTASR